MQLSSVPDWLAWLAPAIFMRKVCRFLFLKRRMQSAGRARTDHFDGFVLDRGFQVLLTAYPEAQKMFDYDALRLQRFENGALVRSGGKFHHLADPWRTPSRAFQTALAPVGSVSDKLKIAQLRRHVNRSSLDRIFDAPETSTSDFLRPVRLLSGCHGAVLSSLS
jgi:phytoene dehydrogenase-like protein